MKVSTFQWAALALLAGAAIYLGTFVVTAQQPPPSQSDKLDQIVQKLDDLTKKVDAMTEKLQVIGEEVHFIKERGK